VHQILEAGYNFTSHESSWKEEWMWVIKSIVTFPEVFLQCLTNGVSGNLQIQVELFICIYEKPLKIITFPITIGTFVKTTFS
jgi:hypothetical protein